MKPGKFSLTANTRILASPNGSTEAESLSRQLGSLTGLPFAVGNYESGKNTGPVIVLELQPDLGKTLGEEGYQLSVQANQIVIKASAPAGLFYGGITLAQLVTAASIQAAVPCVEISDYPRFGYGGE